MAIHSAVARPLYGLQLDSVGSPGQPTGTARPSNEHAHAWPEVLARLRETRSQTELPVIMVTARTQGADIVEAFRADLADGVIQQSFLHFGQQYQGNPPGLPDVVMTTDGGELPPLRTPPDLTVEQYDVEVLFESTSAGVDMYSAATYDGRLVISYHSHGPGPDRYVSEIHDLLAAIPSRYGWVTE